MIFSFNLATLLSTLPLVDVTVKLMLLNSASSYSATPCEFESYAYKLNMIYEVSKGIKVSEVAVAFKNSQTVQLGKLGLTL